LCRRFKAHQDRLSRPAGTKENPLKILVPIKRVIDANVKVRIAPQTLSPEMTGVKMAINPFDEIALEEALRLKEAGIATEVLAVSCGTMAAQEQCRQALALGADRALLISVEEAQAAALQPWAVAQLLQNIVQRENPALVIMGKQAIDDDASQTGPMLAGLLGWPQACFASRIVIQSGAAQVTREIDGGQETLSVALPAVITTDLRLNEPRYATLPNIMKAKKKPIDLLAADTLGVDLKPRLIRLSLEEPPTRQAGHKVADIDQLIVELRQKVEVIGHG
jgi:electron transfer flavoprotein beta subunit